MAAHIVTMLKDISEHEYNASIIKSAIGYTVAGDSLKLDHWQTFDKMADENNLEDIRKFASAILPYYILQWQNLDRPADVEDWRNRQYGKTDFAMGYAIEYKAKRFKRWQNVHRGKSWYAITKNGRCLPRRRYATYLQAKQALDTLILH